MSEVRITSTELGDAATSATGGQVQVTSYDGGNGIVQSVVAGTNVTVDSTDPAHPIVSTTDGGSGAVASVNGHTGTVVLAASDVGADASGAAASAQAAAIAASQPLDSDLTAIAALSTTTFGRALLALADAAALRTSAGLGTAATAASTDFDAAGAAAAAQAASQPLDSDLTAIAALSTTTYGRSLLVSADAAALRTAAGLGTAATSASTAFDAAGAAAAAQAASQPLDSDLTAIAALTTTTYGRAFLALADAAAGRTALGLGTASTSASTDFQPIDSDLTAIAALSTTTFGRSFLALADAAAGRTLLGLGTLATQSGTFSGTSSGTNTGDQDLSTLAPKASPALTGTPTVPTATPGTNTTQAASTAYADAATAVEASRATTAEGLKLAKASNLSDLASATTARTNLGLGTSATVDTGTTSGTIPVLGASGVLAIARLATGTPNGAKFVADDGTLKTPAGGSTPAPILGPTGAIREPYPRMMLDGSFQSMNSGTLFLISLPLVIGDVVSNITFYNGTSLAGQSHWWFGLYDLNRVQLAVTADQLTTAWSGTTRKATLPIATIASGAASSFTATYTGLHYIGACIVATTTAQLAGRTVVNDVPTRDTPIIGGLSNTAQTVPPAFPFTATLPASASFTMPYGYVS